jgi:hypothetical protein
MAVFLSSMAYFEGASPKERLDKAYVSGMKNNFLLWPWVQAVNFKYVPLEHRVFVVNIVALGKASLALSPCPYAWCDRRASSRIYGVVMEGLAVLTLPTGWNCYLSFLNSGGGGGGDTKEVKKEVKKAVGAS